METGDSTSPGLQRSHGPSSEVEAIIQRQDRAIASLLDEVKETNRLLKVLVAQKAPKSLYIDEPVKQPPSPQGTQSFSKAKQQKAKLQVEKLANDYFKELVGEGPEATAVFRDFFISKMGRLHREGVTSKKALSATNFSEKRSKTIKPSHPFLITHSGGNAATAQQQMEVIWSPLKESLKQILDPLGEDEKTYIKESWPLGVKMEDFMCLQGIIYIPDEHGIVLAHRICRGHGGTLRPAKEFLDRFSDALKMAPDDVGLVSEGTTWLFKIRPDDSVMSLKHVSLISQISPTKRPDILAVSLDGFVGSWKSPRLRDGYSSGHWTERDDTRHQEVTYHHCHHIRCFSGFKPNDFDPSMLGLHCSRKGGEFPSLRGKRSYNFTERRASILLSSGQKRAGLPDIQPSVVVISDIPSIESLEDRDMVMGLAHEDHHLTVGGLTAFYQLYQSAIRGVLVFWEKEWSTCLNELDKCVRVTLSAMLDHERSERLMFDASFQRSRVYFKVLQMLRIFSDHIRETGRELDALNPDILVPRSRVSNFPVVPGFDSENDILRENWKRIIIFQAKAEENLLQRIAEKTEEIKSLRDGLFNATALREASKSTTMNRYIIVFTIVTVIYLPPNFIATVFGTDLFNSNDVSSTTQKYAITTVVVSVATYAVAIVLTWLAANMDVVRQTRAYTRTKGLIATIFRREKTPARASNAESAEDQSSEEYPGLHKLNVIRRVYNKAVHGLSTVLGQSGKQTQPSSEDGSKGKQCVAEAPGTAFGGAVV